MEKEILLFPHNEEAYSKLNEMLKTTNYCTVNHATGTGKSFIMLKYLYSNRNKRILYLSPSYAINDQLVNEHFQELGLSKDDFVKFDTMIYTSLLKMNMEELGSQYDIVILDEYQRCGAYQWGKKVSQLMSYIKKNNKICIGTSATPVRYLDHNRNMCDILFDGHVASELSVADAMIDGILPVPYYINYSLDLLEQIIKLRNRIIKNIPYETLQQHYLNLLDELEKKINTIGSEDEEIKDKIIPNGKYLIFSNSISRMDKDIKTIKKALNIDTVLYYSVSAVNSHSVNNEIIREFRTIDNKVPTFLSSVNIANEGLHIKGLDAIFLLRRTSSPIIYLQQIGRLLSFSKNKNQLYVFDLVSNVTNNRVITDLYLELFEKAKIKIVEDPDNRERYQKIIECFKIVDITGKLAVEIEDLTQKLTRSKIIELRLDYAIDILSSDHYSDFDYDKLQAQLDIFKYQKYINREQFKRLSVLPINKPSLFNNTFEQFDKYLGNYNSIQDLFSSKFKSRIQDIYDFYGFVYHLPRLFSSDDNERELATCMMTEFETYNDRVRNFIISHIEDDFSPLEKLIYLSQYDVKDLNNIYLEISKLIEENRPVSIEIIEFLDNQNDLQSSDLLEKIKVKRQMFYVPINDGNYPLDDIKDNEDIKEKYNISSEILLKENTFIEIRNWMKKNQYPNKKEYLSNLYNSLVFFVNQNGSLPLYKKKDELEQELFIQYYIFYNELKEEGYIQKIDDLLKEINLRLRDKRKKEFLLKLISFLDSHDGCLPCKESYNPDEQQLALDYELLSDLFTEDDQNFINQHQTGLELRKNIIIKLYVNFIRNKGRKPLLSNKNEKEYDLALDFLRIEPFLNEEERLIIETATSKLNKYEEQKRLLREMLNEKGTKI